MELKPLVTAFNRKCHHKASHGTWRARLTPGAYWNSQANSIANGGGMPPDFMAWLNGIYDVDF